MRDKFSYKGFWFLPENQGKEIFGILNYDPNKGAKLELFGSLYDRNTNNKIQKLDIILGRSTNGKEITLYDCIEGGRSLSVPGHETTSLIINYVIIGAFFSKGSELVFSSASVGLKNLDEWTDISGININIIDYNQFKTKIEYEKPNSIEFKINNDLIGMFNFAASIHDLSTSMKSASIEQKVQFILRVEKKQIHLHDLLDSIYHFLNFLTIGSFEASYPTEISLRSKKHTYKIDGTIYDKEINLHFSSPIIPEKDREKHTFDMLFNYGDISGEFDTIIRRWYKNKTRFKPIINLIVDSFYRTNKPVENQFLDIVQAIETFHRRTRNNEVLPKSEHKKRIETILNSVPGEFVEWLKEKLAFSNEPSLHKRLDELISQHANSTLIKIIKDKTAFIKQVKNSRNYYTHYDPKLEKKSLRGTELFFLKEKLKVLLICAILKETNFDSSLIEKLFSRNKHRFVNHLINQ